MSWRAAAALLLVAWGAFAFGAVYPWAFVPLYAGAALTGIAALAQTAREHRSNSLLPAALALVAAAIALQLVPFPLALLRAVSPNTDAFLRQYAVGYTAASRHSLSIDPPATETALAAFCALALLLWGLTRALARADSVHIARGIAVIGVCLAIAGMAQKAMWNGKIYGFWTTIQGGNPFGPFVNRNHFAGWMLMALPLEIGYFCGRLIRSRRSVEPGRKVGLAWVTSADASETALVGFAIVVMAVSLVAALSRSGILGLAVAFTVSGWWVVRRQGSGSMRLAIAVFFAAVVVGAIAWVGFERVAARFAVEPGVSMGGRLEIWADTWRMVRDFPLTGTGLNTYGTAMLTYQTAVLDKHFAQAHNDYLQIIAEGGLLVAIPVAVAIAIFVWRLRVRFSETSPERTDYWIRVGAVTGVAAIAFQELGDFSLQIPGNALLFALLLAIVARQPSHAR